MLSHASFLNKENLLWLQSSGVLEGHTQKNGVVGLVAGSGSIEDSVKEKKKKKKKNFSFFPFLCGG